MTVTFVNNPQLPFRVRQVGTMVQIKPFAGYYIWLDWFDLAPLDPTPIMDYLVSALLDLSAIDTALAGDIATAIGQASTAQSAADAAQSSANTALANAATAQGAADTIQIDSFRFFGDELVYSVGTPASGVQPTFPYNWITFTTTNSAQCKIDLSLRPGTWTFKFLLFKRNDAARLDVSLDGFVIITALDLYAAAQNLSFVHTLTGVTVGSDPIQDMAFTVNGKNASSSSFVMIINKVWGYRTGA